MSIFGGIAALFRIFLIIGIVVVVAIVALIIIFACIGKNKNTVQTAKVKVVEKLAKNGNVEWYGIKFENGARARLCYTQGATIPMNVGDVGVIRYKGEMIEMFQFVERS